MFIRLLLLFSLVPVIEIYFLIEVGSRIGTLNTLAIILVTGILGAYLTRQQGFYVISQIRSTSGEGRIPGKELLHGLFVLIGGITLLTPGLLTDIAGFTMLIPYFRNIYVEKAFNFFKDKVHTGYSGYNNYS